MKSDQQNFLDMCKRVKKFYRNNEYKFKSARGLGQLMARLNLLSSKLELEFEHSISFPYGYTIESARKREHLQQQCLEMCGNMQVARNAMKYKSKSDFDRFYELDHTELSLLDDEELISYASGIYDMCTGMESRLKTVGVYKKSIDTLSKKLTLFALDYPRLRQSVEKRKYSHLQALKLISEISDFFNYKLDPYFETIALGQPLLYRAYTEARTVVMPDLNAPCDFEGVAENGKLICLAELKYDKDREFLLVVSGGNAVWGLGKTPDKIDFGMPVSETQKIRVSSRILGPEGDFLGIQPVLANTRLDYKVWIIQ